MAVTRPSAMAARDASWKARADASFPAASDAFDLSSEASRDGCRRSRPCAPHPRPAPSGPGCGPWSPPFPPSD